MKKIKKSKVLKHETKRHALNRFLLIIGVAIIYLAWMIYHFGAKSGLEVTALTWSFFVLCTPIADAGFLLDFPIRLISGLKMMITEILVWIIAIGLNLYFFFVYPEVYNKTAILEIFKHILEKPIPFWTIILLSGIGTFLSIYFGDELMDTIKHHQREKHQKHKNKHRFIIFIFILVLILVLYNFALKELGVSFNFL